MDEPRLRRRLRANSTTPTLPKQPPGQCRCHSSTTGFACPLQATHASSNRHHHDTSSNYAAPCRSSKPLQTICCTSSNGSLEKHSRQISRTEARNNSQSQPSTNHTNPILNRPLWRLGMLRREAAMRTASKQTAMAPANRLHIRSRLPSTH